LTQTLSFKLTSKRRNIRKEKLQKRRKCVQLGQTKGVSHESLYYKLYAFHDLTPEGSRSPCNLKTTIALGLNFPPPPPSLAVKDWRSF
jgi:hypothetical protein